MSNLVEQYLLRALREAAADYRVAGETTTLLLAPLDVTLAVGAVDGPTENGVVSGEILASHPRLAAPIRFMAIGSGEDVASATRSAAAQWFDVVFPPLHSMFTNHGTEDASVAKVSAVCAGERFAWRVHLGRIRVLFSGTSEPAQPDDGVLLHALRHEVTGVCAHREVFWIDAFAARLGDRTIRTDCRLANECWPEGVERLRSVTPELLPETGGFVSYRQLMLFEPVPV